MQTVQPTTITNISEREDMMVDAYISQHHNTHLPLANTNYSQTRIIVNMNIHPISMHAFDSTTCPDPFKDTLEYYCKIGIFINNLPQFHNEQTFFVFYIQNKQTLEYKEWIRFEGADGNYKDICFGSLFLNYMEAMNLLNSTCRMVMIHGSHQRSREQAVELRTTLAYKG
ncbi:predicted protein [Naegleria gruberi]|uniref:Predicted protein n=1 Tax=Naegleria gruberi TaxID=5762 RepID=D2VUN2_NAEGR|nr:uncharacterized protein NAEGRDRAFT_72724 [Naegleria gruberi]EFC39481.1 predicted protein [Naegleria gruberi]|eukprot:XP_002672225.1 predicted protein [Naegleria gruberi strain NEG-M]